MQTGAFAGKSLQQAFGGKEQAKKKFPWRERLKTTKKPDSMGTIAPAADRALSQPAVKGLPLDHPNGSLTPEEFAEI